MNRRLALVAAPLILLAACSSGGGSSDSSSSSTTSSSSPSSSATASSSSSSTGTTSKSSTPTSSTTRTAAATPQTRTTSPQRAATQPAKTVAPTPAKTATCTNLGTGAQYPCTQDEYDREQWDDGIIPPTKADCTAKNERATYDMCHALGYNWGMTEREMRQHDAGANCATGTQLYWAEHTCYIVKEEGTSITYNDGSVFKY